MTAMTPDPQQPLVRRRRIRRLLVRIGLGLAGVAAGVLCGYLPDEYQALCRLAAKLFALFGGG